MHPRFPGLASVLALLFALPSCGADETLSPAPQPPGDDAGADVDVQPEAGADTLAEAAPDATESGGQDVATTVSFTLEQSFTITSLDTGRETGCAPTGPAAP